MLIRFLFIMILIMALIMGCHRKQLGEQHPQPHSVKSQPKEQKLAQRTEINGWEFLGWGLSREQTRTELASRQSNFVVHFANQESHINIS